MGDYAGFMAMDTAMTNNWHQPIQSIGSSKVSILLSLHACVPYPTDLEILLLSVSITSRILKSLD